jgi:hypothetical protein
MEDVNKQKEIDAEIERRIAEREAAAAKEKGTPAPENKPEEAQSQEAPEKPALTLMDIVNNQSTTKRASDFTEYNSKKKLVEAGVLTASQQEMVMKLKGTFTFHIHNSKKYLVITLFNSSNKEYNFLVVKLDTMEVIESDTIKNAKQIVLEKIKEEETKTEQQPA